MNTNLKKLNNNRIILKILETIMLMAPLIFFIIVVLSLLLQIESWIGTATIGWIICIFVYLLFSIYYHNFRAKLNINIMPEIVQSMKEKIDYTYEEQNMYRFLNRSKLFKNMTFANSEQSFRGEYNGSSFYIHQLHAYYKEWQPIFTVQENTIFSGVMISLSLAHKQEIDMQYFPKRGFIEFKNIYANYIDRMKFITRKNQLIDENFYVRGMNSLDKLVNDVEEYLLFLNRKGIHPFVSFNNGVLYVLIPTNEKPFELPTKEKLTEENFKNLQNQLKTYITIAKDLINIKEKRE